MKKIMFAALCLTPFFVSAQPLNFNAMAKKCAKDIDPMTFQAIARTESSFNPYAIGVVNGVLRRQPCILNSVFDTEFFYECFYFFTYL